MEKISFLKRKSHKPLLEILTGITAPKHLDLSLFKDYTDKIRKIIETNKLLFPNRQLESVFSVVSGCKNFCPHCAVEGQAPYGIASLPFPLVQQISKVTKELGTIFVCYHGSDPGYYYDPFEQGNFVYVPTIITKGVDFHLLNTNIYSAFPKIANNPVFLEHFLKRQEREQRCYDALARFRDCGVKIGLSYVGGEWPSSQKELDNFYENLAMLEGSDYCIQALGSGPKFDEFLQSVKGCEIHTQNTKIDAIGRAASETFQALTADTCYYGGNTGKFLLEATGDVYIMGSIELYAGGRLEQICDEEPRIGRRFVYIAVGNIFDSSFDQKLDILNQFGTQIEWSKKNDRGMSEPMSETPLDNSKDFPLVIPAYLTANLQNKVIDNPSKLPPLPKGNLMNIKLNYSRNRRQGMR